MGTHPDRHRRLRLDPYKRLEGRLALGQPGMPVQLSHLRRLAGTGARQLPLSGLDWSSLVLRRPPPLVLSGPLPLRKVPSQPVVLRSLLHPSGELWPPPPCPACLHCPCPPRASLHPPRPPAEPHPQRLHRSTPGCRSV